MTRMRSLVRAGTLGLVLAAATGAAAQQLTPPQALPPVLAAQLPARQQPAGVVVYGSVGAGWDSNPEGLNTQVQNASFGGFGNLAVAKTWTTPHSSFTLSGNGRAVRYSTAEARSRFDYGGALSMTTALDTRTRLGLNFGANLQHNDQLFDPATTAVLLPVTRTQSLTASGDLSHTFGTRTELAFVGSWSNLRFDLTGLQPPAQPVPATGPAVQNGSGLATTVRLSRAVAERSQLSAFYAFQTDDYQSNGRVKVHTLGSGYGLGLGAHSRATVSVGADAFSRETIPGTSYTLYVAGNYAITGRRTSFVSSYRRGISPTTGLAYDRVLQLFAASLSSAPNTWLTVVLTGLHAINQYDAVGNQYTYPTDEASASLRARLNRSLGLTLLNQYRRRGEIPNQPQVTNYRATLSVDFGRTFR